MLEFRFIVVVGLMLMSYTHSQSTDTTIESSTTIQNEQTSILSTANGPTTPLSTTNDQSLTSEGTTQSTSMPITETEFTTTTNKPNFTLFYQCDFSNECFDNDPLLSTNGSQFNPVQTGDTYDPPRAPTSDVTSITTPTSNGEFCDLPYQIPGINFNNASEWNMSFCYNNQCPTYSSKNATCKSGSYGLVALNSSESTMEALKQISSPTLLRDSNGDQCLRFYFYFTVDNGENRGQQIQIWIRPDDVATNGISVQNLTIDDMKENKWEFRAVTFQPTVGNYTLVFNFSISTTNTSDESTFNETIYFALDNIELYDYNCTYVEDQLTTSAYTEVTTTTTGNNNETVTDVSAGANLPLILGLSLGIGIPVLVIGSIAGVVYFKKFRGEPNSARFDIPLRAQTSKTSNSSFRNSFAF